MPITSVASFVEALKQSRVLAPAQLAEVERDLQLRFPEARALAKELVQSGWLTPYQVNQLLQGKGRDLLLGPFVLLERLGEGGMGQVFKARHQKLGRIVALKLIRKERVANPNTVRRFHREVRAAAQLSHPNIVIAYDADQVGNSHYFAMEYVEGIDLAKLVKERGRLPVHDACDYMRQVALGLQHAHEHGMVHRDIKPANLLIADCGLRIANSPLQSPVRGSQSAIRNPQSAIVKILDLGLARLRMPDDGSDSSSSLTQEGTVMGTPDYIAPEQAMSSHDVDIRADLYSLGCTFYFLLAGKVPFPGGSLMEKLVKHRMDEPPPLEEVRPEVPAEVADIVRRLMAKQPEERFQTPAELAAALEEWLAGQTVPAPTAPEGHAQGDGGEGDKETVPFERITEEQTPGSLLQHAAASRARREQKQRRLWRMALAGIGGVLLLGLVVVAIIMLSSNSHSPEKPGGAEDNNGPKPAAGIKVQIEANKVWQDTGIDVTAKIPVTIRASGQWKMGPTTVECTAGGAVELPHDRNVLPEANAMCLLARVGSEDVPRAVGKDHTFYPPVSGRLFVQANDLDLEDNAGSLTLDIQGGTRSEKAVQLPPLTSIQAADQAWKKHTADAEAALAPLNAKVGQPTTDADALRQEIIAFRVQYAGTPAALRAADFLKKLPSPLDQFDPKDLPGDAVAYWRAADLNPSIGLVAVLGEHRQRHWGPATCLAFTSRGQFLVSGGSDGAVCFWDAKTLTLVKIVYHRAVGVVQLAASPDARWLAVGFSDSKVHLLEVNGAEAKLVRVLDGPPGQVAFSPDGKLLAFRGDPSISLLDLGSPDLKSIGIPVVNDPDAGMVGSFAFSPDGRSLFSGSKAVQVWDLEQPPTKRRQLKFPGSESVWSVAVASNGKWAATACSSGRGSLWKLTGDTAEEQVLRMNGSARVAFSPGGELLAVGTTGAGDISLYALAEAEAKERTVLKGHLGTIRALAFAPDGKTLASASDDGAVRLWDVATGKELYPLDGQLGAVSSVAVSLDGKLLAAGGADGSVRLWNLTKRPLREPVLLSGHTKRVGSVAFALDGKTLVTASDDLTLRLWDLTAPEPKELTAFKGSGCYAEFSPDGKRVASNSLDGDTSARFWEVSGGAKQPIVLPHPTNVYAVAFSPDGRSAATGLLDGSIWLWDVSGLQPKERGQLKGHPNRVIGLAFSPDGRTLASRAGDTRLWDLATGQERLKLEGCSSLTFSPDGRMLAMTSGSGLTVRDASTGDYLLGWQFPGPVQRVAFAADARHVATANGNGTVYLLRLPSALRDLDKLPRETCLDFNGQSHVVVPTWNYKGDQPITLEAWATPRDITKNQEVMSNFQGAGLGLRLIGTWQFMFAANGYQTLNATRPPENGRRTHLAGVYDGKELRFYVDGELQSSFQTTGPHGPSGLPFLIGANPEGGETASTFFDGQIDEVRISRVARYKERFTPAQRFEPDGDTIALYHFDEGTGDTAHDASASKHDAQIKGATWKQVRVLPRP